jgi:hypothetical protein
MQLQSIRIGLKGIIAIIGMLDAFWAGFHSTGDAQFWAFATGFVWLIFLLEITTFKAV